jgi:hypothetical protein
MTKKDFIRVAKAISKIKDFRERRGIAVALKQICSESNPRFDAVKFYKACGL